MSATHIAGSSQPEGVPEQPLLLTVLQVAALLNVSTRTIRNLLNSGQLVRRKIGAATRIPRSSVEKFLKRDHPTRKRG